MADVEEGRAWRCTAKETGFERDLYRLPSAPPENEFALETGPLREVEGQAIPILRSMNENRALPVGPDYARIILYLFVQFIRTPAFLGHVAKIALGLMQDLMRKTASSDEEWERFLNESKGEPPPISREEMKTIELEGKKVIEELGKRFGINLGAPDVSRLRPAGARRKRTSRTKIVATATTKPQRSIGAVSITREGSPKDVARFFRSLAD